MKKNTEIIEKNKPNLKSNKTRFLGLSQNFWHELKILAVLIIIALTIKATIVEIYVVPTGSMEDTILTGDMLIGNKFVYGMRTPVKLGILWTRLGIDIPWFRLPKFKEVESGDVTIFEFPRDPFQKYVKRCIGIAGDSIFIQNAEIFVNGDKMELPEEAKFVKGQIFSPEKEQALFSYFDGNQDNIKPFVVPYKGMEIDLENVTDWTSTLTLLVQDGNNVELFDKNFTIIDPDELGRMKGFLKYKILGLFQTKSKVYQKQRLDQRKYIKKLKDANHQNNTYNPWELNFSSTDDITIFNNLKINGEPVKNFKKYVLKHDYYYFMGDNRDSSFDSRFWGFVPDSHILGTPLISVVNLFKFKLRFKTVS